MCAKPDQSELRERAIARLMPGALKPGRSTGGADAAACPDAELVAAYADRGLAGSERAELETHFAACERCQKILAALGVGLEAAVGESVAVMPVPAAPHVAARPSSSSQRWLWWLTPAFGAAAAALLWMVLRPASTRGPALLQTASDYSGVAQQEPRTLNAPAAALPVEPSPATPRRDLQALGRLSKTEPAVIQGGVFDQTGGAIVGAKVEITDVALGVTRNLTTDDAGQYVAPALNAGTYTVRAEASGFSALERKNVLIEVGQDARVDLELHPGEQTQTVAVAEEVPSAQFRATAALGAGPAPPGAATQAATITEQNPAVSVPPSLNQTTQTVTVTEAAPPIQARARAAIGGAGPAPQALVDLPLSGRNFAQLLNLVYTYTFASPDGGARWRLGTAGHIERSTDRGQTWQPQSSGVTVDLIAGSGSSKDVAWVVGREGVILRSTDGEHWERIPTPSSVSSPWAAVAAHDAMSATVVAEDLRRFSTTDGGRTWMQQP